MYRKIRAFTLLFIKGKVQYGILAIVMLYVSCAKNTNQDERAFYYWMSNFKLSKKNIAYLHDVKVTKLYLHFFDVVWDSKSNDTRPIDEINFTNTLPKEFSCIPVVYITVEALQQLNEGKTNELGKRILMEINHIDSVNNLNPKEIQFDCDWTESTKTKYFALLSFIGNNIHDKGEKISATIRLHQVKYSAHTGIPPVDRGMLMFYNMGRINAVRGYNSIYSDKDARNYSSYIKDYTLPLDITLPIFSWTLQMREGKVVDLFQKTDENDYLDTSLFKDKENSIFVSRASFFLHRRYIMKNDSLKMEELNPEMTEDAETEAMKYLTGEKRTVSLFEYDSLYISHYTQYDIEKIFSASH